SPISPSSPAWAGSLSTCRRWPRPPHATPSASNATLPGGTPAPRRCPFPPAWVKSLDWRSCSLAERADSKLPCVVLFNINGSGMGHMSTCLAYAHRLRGRARPVFFSLASAIEMIEDMGFEADYFVSRFWSRATSWAWDKQLALRLGMLFERVRPDVVVFDGTWPYRGLREAATIYGVPHLVWSNLKLYKQGMRKVPVRETDFDLIIQLGELGASFSVDRVRMPGRKLTI